METLAIAKAEEKKKQGNEEHKKGNYTAAVKLYQEAIDFNGLEPSYFTNKALSLIQMKEFKKAIEESENALKINPKFARAFQRLFKCYLSIGDFNNAKLALQKSQEIDPTDANNAKDAKTLESVLTQERVVARHIEKQDYETSINYLDQILNECPASETHALQKLEYLLRSSKLQEAVTYSEQAARIFKSSSPIQTMRGRIMFYNGNDARKQLLHAQELDPDNLEIKKYMKNILLSTQLKEKATETFKKGDIQAAIDQFQDCLDLDELNINFNSTIYLNIALGFSKQNKNEEALKMLNKAIQLNPKYAKAFVKRGDINQALGNSEEALRDYQMAHQLEPKEFNVEDKIKHARVKAKDAAKKDYYKILGVSKDASDADIKKAYRKLAAKWHPDHNQGSEEEKQKADKMFKDINEANQVLSDPDTRRKFDMGGYDPSDPTGGMSFGGSGMNIDPSQLFSMFFGGGSGGMGGMGGMEDMFGGIPRGGGRGGRGASRGGAQFPGGFPGGFSFTSGGPGGFGGFPGPSGGRGGRGSNPFAGFGM